MRTLSAFSALLVIAFVLVSAVWPTEVGFHHVH
jgi:hypothetical protein